MVRLAQGRDHRRHRKQVTQTTSKAATAAAGVGPLIRRTAHGRRWCDTSKDRQQGKRTPPPRKAPHTAHRQPATGRRSLTRQAPPQAQAPPATAASHWQGPHGQPVSKAQNTARTGRKDQRRTPAPPTAQTGRHGHGIRQETDASHRPHTSDTSKDGRTASDRRRRTPARTDGHGTRPNKARRNDTTSTPPHGGPYWRPATRATGHGTAQ